jgi:hypothetical protein
MCKCKIEAQLHNDSCHGKAISITYSECLPIALVIFKRCVLSLCILHLSLRSKRRIFTKFCMTLMPLYVIPRT